MPFKAMDKKPPQKLLFPLRGVDPSNTPLTTQMTAQLLRALSHNCRTKSPLVTMRHPKLTPKIAPYPWVITTPI